MEDAKIIQEEEALNLELKEEEDIKDISNPKTYTEEEVEEMKRKFQSDSAKGVEKIRKDLTLYERAYNELGNISTNPERLIEINEENPELAKKILEDYYPGQDIEEYKKQIGYQDDLSDPKKLDALIEKKAKEIASQEKIESEKESFIEKLEMTDEEKQSFTEQLSELMELKSFKAEDIKKVMDKAYRLSVNEDGVQNKLKNAEVIAQSMATAKGGKSEKGGTTQKNPFVDFYKKYS